MITFILGVLICFLMMSDSMHVRRETHGARAFLFEWRGKVGAIQYCEHVGLEMDGLYCTYSTYLKNFLAISLCSLV